MADVILDAIAERCPRLFRLSLFPSRTLKYEENNLLGYLRRRPYYESLQTLPALVELTCSTMMLERDSLGVISSLPQLHRLIVLTSGTTVVLRPSELPRESFPALQQLHIKGLSPYEVITILGIPTLMSSLTHLELKFKLDQLDEDEDRDEWIASELLSLLRFCPQLLSLDLDLDPTRVHDDPYDIGHQDLMDTFSKLPLANVALGGVHLGDWAYTGSLKSVWPNVTILRMRDQFASPRILSCFAQLPRVQYLMLNVYLEDFRECPKVVSLCPLQTLECSPGGSTVCEPEMLDYTGRGYRTPEVHRVPKPTYYLKARARTTKDEVWSLRGTFVELVARLTLMVACDYPDVCVLCAWFTTFTTDFVVVGFDSFSLGIAVANKGLLHSVSKHELPIYTVPNCAVPTRELHVVKLSAGRYFQEQYSWPAYCQIYLIVSRDRATSFMIPMEATTITPKASRVFEVPELLSLICSFARTSDCARLSRTCRTAFNVAVAFVWDQTNGQHLLLLLGATRIVSTNKTTGSKSTIIKIGSPSPAKFSRFDVYAPYVRELDVYGPTYHHYQVDGWDRLILHARQRPLLPNLSSIIFHSFADVHGSDELVWVKTFISSSVTKVGAIAGNFKFPTYMPSLVVDVIMSTVAECCPRLLKLSLFPTPDHLSDKPKASDNLLGFLWRRPYHESLSRLPNLVELTCSMGMFERDSLLVISSLPALRRLTVFGFDGVPVLHTDSLSSESFPTLHELQLAELDRECLTSVLRLPPLMSHLTHLELDYQLDEPGSDDEEDQGERIALDVLSRLEDSPRLRSLDLNVNFFGEPHDIGRKDVMEIFSKLPLESITLGGMRVGYLTYNAEHLKTAWLNVTSVHMPDQLGSPNVLRHFAQLPRLQYLEVNLCLEIVVDCPNEVSLCPLHTLESSDDGDIAHEPEDLGPIGDFLLTLFPNLGKVVWPRAQKNGPPEAAAQERFVGFLNQYMALKREVEGLKAKLGAKM
ncbi:hypothetical protein FRC10_007404 [Ceratobasidium sp. 414]|nr:hypothetical protein FRC10_007404 [Ceratobasidium sp. 414]